jgi:hypothetical protein
MCSVLFSRKTSITFLNRSNRSTTVLWDAESEVFSILDLRLQRENGPENYHSFQGWPSVPFLYKINVSDITRHTRATFIGLYDFGREGPVWDAQLGRTDRQAEDGRQNLHLVRI